MLRRLVLAAAAVLAAAGFAALSASASPRLLVGLYDEPHVLGGPEKAFPMLRTLRAQVVRTNLYWGGPLGVARLRPLRPLDPADPAYDWTLYDRTVEHAAKQRIKLVFSIYGTPRWASGWVALNRVPRRPRDLQDFAFAAARRYSGTFRVGKGEEERTLPAVRHWLAWNEPNNRLFLSPQYRRVGGRWVMQSAIDYAKICNAVYNGVHRSGLPAEKVACGVTAPRGNNQPNSTRPAPSPLAFMRAMKKAGARRFDAYAHHPYYGKRFETPLTPPAASTAITLGNFDVLVKELTRLYGHKRIWITEYGYQTPPERLFGVSFVQQAAYLRQAYAIARKHPRIDMMLWFLLQDQPGTEGWQSGLLTASGRRKPAFQAFQRLPR